MRIKDGFVLREVAGQGVVIATGEASENFHGMIRLNATGELIWKALTDGKTEDGIVAELTARFDVSESQARADVADFIRQMSDNGFLVE
ncbi:coenzyme PQQ synthesis protein [Bifidobacterium margollesii]|uniref:Coenzyme PQQ synthesis protein n=1 Tax=Bifidobacterium margollesii TaxID=2020964 RepID=A0A2N5JB42_9BIFI|nr:PqqD family protein [Bifidobacterium margollesii]PLS31401.1 coenzyme PQQ synthesis protein [Bifidobacterium margollesii]